MWKMINRSYASISKMAYTINPIIPKITMPKAQIFAVSRNSLFFGFEETFNTLTHCLRNSAIFLILTIKIINQKFKLTYRVKEVNNIVNSLHYNKQYNNCNCYKDNPDNIFKLTLHNLPDLCRFLFHRKVFYKFLQVLPF